MKTQISGIAPVQGAALALDIGAASIDPTTTVIGASAGLVGATFDVYGTTDPAADETTPNKRFLGVFKVPAGIGLAQKIPIDTEGWPVIVFVQTSAIAPDAHEIFAAGELAPRPVGASAAVAATPGDWSGPIACSGKTTRIVLGPDAVTGDYVEVWEGEDPGATNGVAYTLIARIKGGSGQSVLTNASYVMVRTITHATPDVRVYAAAIDTGSGTDAVASVLPRANEIVKRDALAKVYATQYKGSAGNVAITDVNVSVSAEAEAEIVAVTGKVTVSAAKGLVLPVKTTVERDAIVGPAEGTIIYNSTTHKINVRVNGAWEAVTSA